MKWLAALAFTVTLLAGPADARPDDKPDMSDPDLVKRYITFPCKALKDSYTFQFAMAGHDDQHLNECYKKLKTGNYQYGELMCAYALMQKQFILNHAFSSLKAHELMCDDDDTRKNPEYEIHF